MVSMNGHRLKVWVGRDAKMLVSCFSVSIFVSGFPYAAQSLRCLLQGWCVFGFFCRFAPKPVPIHTNLPTHPP